MDRVRHQVVKEPLSCFVNNVSPLAAAAENGYLNCVRHLIKEWDIDLNKKNNRGRTPVSLAAGNGFAVIVTEFLFKERLTPNLRI